MHRLYLVFICAAVLLAGCDSTSASAPRVNDAPSAGGIDGIADVRLDVYPEPGDDFLRRQRVAAASYVGATVEQVAADLAPQGKVPFAFYSEGIESQPVTMTIPAGASMQQAISQLAQAAGCRYAYYLNLHDQTVVGGIKLTRHPFKSYAKDQLGSMYLVYP